MYIDYMLPIHIFYNLELFYTQKKKKHTHRVEKKLYHILRHVGIAKYQSDVPQ